NNPSAEDYATARATQLTAKIHTKESPTLLKRDPRLPQHNQIFNLLIVRISTMQLTQQGEAGHTIWTRTRTLSDSVLANSSRPPSGRWQRDIMIRNSFLKLPRLI